jgi:hypothetical protein
VTAADVRRLPIHVQLPMLATDDRVRVFDDLEVDALDECHACANRTDLPLDAPIPDARMSLTFHWRMGGREQRVDVCAADCADAEMDDLLNLHHVVGMRLHIPPRSRFLPSGTPRTPVAAVNVELPLIYDALIRVIRNAPNSATVDMSGRDGFEHCRHALMADFEQLRRGAA